MKATLTSITCASLCAASVSAAGFDSDFSEASLGAIAGLGKDTPGAPSADFGLNTGTGMLDFTVDDGFNADMWGSRNNAAIAWVANPNVANGQTWSVETYVAMENNGANPNEVAGLTFYADSDGSNPDFTFGLDDWNGWNVRLQGLGNNNPNVGSPDLGNAPGVFLRVEVAEGGATDTYNFFWKVNQGDAWTQIGGVATNFESSFDNSRIGLFHKTDSSGGGAAQFDYLTVSTATGLIGDFDGDGDVDGVDIAEMFSNFNGPGGGVPTNPDTDLDADGDVDGVDIATLFGVFTGPLSPTAVPEPGSLALLGLGGLLIARRRRG